ncbi:MAG: hypothetical protein OSB43_06265 [Nocardioides sp.]|uniref:hypothetical protein n=1 Tax=Nocardioides sp. TaxID=35761 RepID=UPI0023901947|nr:hypothetical protein [Nocardioides sp.]MDE0775855.1 hypothetical protein [Nocardioides sp.]
MTSPPALTIAEQLTAWGTVATAAFTLALVVMAFFAWRTAHSTLNAARDASRASAMAADAARVANEQAARDSIASTRPYVFAEVIPGLAGITAWDLRVTNAGQSVARRLTLDYSDWPLEIDDVGESIKRLFETPRTLPPSSSIRVIWRIEGNFDDGTSVAGLGRSGTINVTYSSDDPTQPNYQDTFDVMVDNSGLWPVPEQGANADGLQGDAKRFYRLGQVLVRRVGELSR